jgi:predicted O-linked N-acetylglucosamine transferase (SPINDLY family)
MTNLDGRVNGLLDQGLILHRQGRLAEARAHYLALLELAPAHSRAWHLLAVVALQTNKPELALEPLAKALEHDASNLAALKDYARTLGALKRYEAALAAYEKAIGISPNEAELFAGRGNACFELKQFSRAIENYDQCLRLDPTFAGGHFNRAMALLDLEDYDGALKGFDVALSLDPNHARARNFRGAALAALTRFEEAVASFDAALALHPDYADAYLNRGMALMELERWAAALQSFEAAIELERDFPHAHNNRGNALYQLGRIAEALQSYERAVQLGPGFPGMHFNRAQMLAEMGRYGEAAEEFDHTLALNPRFDYAAGEALLARLQASAWQGYEPRRRALEESLQRGERAATPFALLALSDSPQLQQQAARSWIIARPPKASPAPRMQRKSGKLVIGYFSPDFRDHPVARLAAPLFESHDRAQFEVLGFSFGPDTGDTWRRRVSGGVDRFLDVAATPARDVAALARDLGVDVAVDLAGLTKHCRPAIFAARAAPVQVSYLGFLGTLGAPFMDYLLADRSLVPDSLRPYYDEKLAYLPHYHLNDTALPNPTDIPSRESLGLPQDAFAFACFNSTYKITPDGFALWMRILRRAPNAVLMLQGEAAMAGRLRGEALRFDIDAKRLIFAPRLPLKEYVGRLAALDLFLDTFPYNAGTTASDALCAGLPVLTLRGNTFASRVATSALAAVGLSELSCCSAEAYENLAVAIASQPERQMRLKRTLLQERASALIFDAKRFTRCLERAFEHMIQRQDRGDAPMDFEIAP